MIYMVDHVYADPATEEAWHEWYAGYLQKLVSVPGIHSAQRFKALDCVPSRYLAMYSIDSADVYTSEPYRKMGGGGSQSARFHHAYRLWTRNLFDAEYFVRGFYFGNEPPDFPPTLYTRLGDPRQYGITVSYGW